MSTQHEATVERVLPSDGCTTVELSWTTSDHVITDFDVSRCGKVWRAGGEFQNGTLGYVLVEGEAKVRPGDKIPLLPPTQAGPASTTKPTNTP